MTVCPFCKKMVVNPDGGPCPSCGKVAPRAAVAAAPAPATANGGGGDQWDELEIQRGSSGQQPMSGPSSYSGGGIGGLGDDDDQGPGLALELDAPVRSQAPPQMSSPPPNSRAGASGGHPQYRNEAMPQPLPARSGRSDPAMAQQQSAPNVAPPSSSHVAVQQPQQPPPASMYGSPPGGPPDAAMMIARYPAPPREWWRTPAYAMRVLYRQFELRQDIDALKKKRSPDVPLYERALKTHDGGKFAIGMAINVAIFMVATTLFFLPVIKRFAFDN